MFLLVCILVSSEACVNLGKILKEIHFFCDMHVLKAHAFN